MRGEKFEARGGRGNVGGKGRERGLFVGEFCFMIIWGTRILKILVEFWHGIDWSTKNYALSASGDPIRSRATVFSLNLIWEHWLTSNPIPKSLYWTRNFKFMAPNSQLALNGGFFCTFLASCDPGLAGKDKKPEKWRSKIIWGCLCWKKLEVKQFFFVFSLFTEL